RAAIESAQLLIFLISPDAVDGGSYTLSELEIGQKAGVKILPVMLRVTEVATLPVVLRSITIYQPQGDVAAGVAAEVHRIARELRRKRLKPLAGVVAAATLLAVVLYAVYFRKGNEFAGKDGAPAVLIPAGSFVMGDDENSPRREIFAGDGQRQSARGMGERRSEERRRSCGSRCRLAGCGELLPLGREAAAHRSGMGESRAQRRRAKVSVGQRPADAGAGALRAALRESRL